MSRRQGLVARYSQRSVADRMAERSAQTFNWYRFFPDSMPVHVVGRTCTVQPMFGDAEVERLIEDLDYTPVRGWTSLSVVQQVDFMATWLIAQAKEEQHLKQGKGEEYSVLSASQFMDRRRKEIPMEMGALDALLTHRPDRAQMYRGGVSFRATPSTVFQYHPRHHQR